MAKNDRWMLRYKTDPEFRKNHIEAVKKYKKKKSLEKKMIKQQLKRHKVYWKKFKINGEVVECCTIGYLAKGLKRETQTVRKWENEKLLPKTFSYKNRRYYTKYHYDLIIMMWERYGNNLSIFFDKVAKNWNKKIRQ